LLFNKEKHSYIQIHTHKDLILFLDISFFLEKHFIIIIFSFYNNRGTSSTFSFKNKNTLVASFIRTVAQGHTGTTRKKEEIEKKKGGKKGNKIIKKGGN